MRGILSIPSKWISLFNLQQMITTHTSLDITPLEDLEEGHNIIIFISDEGDYMIQEDTDIYDHRPLEFPRIPDHFLLDEGLL